MGLLISVGGGRLAPCTFVVNQLSHRHTLSSTTIKTTSMILCTGLLLAFVAVIEWVAE